MSLSGRFLIAGVGASAGGVEALKQLLGHLPAQPQMAFVVVQHLDPSLPTMMVEILSRETKLPVEEARDGMRVEPNHIYLISPDTSLTITDGTLHTVSPSGHSAVATQIDRFLYSLAEDQGENCVAIILSGAGTDGSLGLRAVKEHGGIAIAQAPFSAAHTGMPSSAIATGLVDYILPPEEIGPRLAQQVAYLERMEEASAIDELRQEITKELPRICEILHTATGHDFSQYRRGTLVRRVERRMQLNHLDTVGLFIEKLGQDSNEAGRLLKDVLISVTRFFRDPEAFETLKKEVIPKLFEGSSRAHEIRIWVPGCATGEEAYSIGMLISEYMAKHNLRIQVQIFATDIDTEALETARRGRYPPTIADQVSEDRLRRFFVEDGEWLRVSKELRSLCVFSVHNLINDPPFSSLDLVSCRNLLIYMEPELQKMLVPMFHYALREGGFLFLGSAEGLAAYENLFCPISARHRISKRNDKGVRPRISFPFESARPQRALRQSPLSLERPVDARDNMLRAFERRILNEFAFPSLLVNAQGDIVYACGDTSRYLKQPAGPPSTNILELTRKGLRTGIHSTLRQAVEAGEPRMKRDIRLRGAGGEEEQVDLYISPMQRNGAGEALFAVVLKPRERIKKVKALPEGSENTIVRGLETELDDVRGELQFTVDGLVSSNQSLKSANEELQSMNEELQSANEELQTAKEEFQSLNEELETVNNQLSRKVTELDEANSDLQNLFRSTEIATVFLCQKLLIKKFTPAAADLLNLLPGDIGRPLSDLALPFKDLDLFADLKEALRSVSRKENLVYLPETQKFFVLRILPSRAADDSLNGLVVTFVDVTSLKRAERRSRQFYDSGLVGIAYWDSEGGITEANRSFLDMLGYDAAALEQGLLNWKTLTSQPPESSDGGGEEPLEVRKFVPYESELITRDGRNLPVLIGAGVLDPGQKEHVSFVLDISSLSSERAAHIAAVQANRLKDDFLATLSHELRTPLNSILGWSQLLAKEGAHSERAMRAIESGARSMAQLVEDLLDMGRLLAGKLRIRNDRLQLAHVVTAAIGTIELAAEEKGVALDLELEESLPPIWGDELRLQQVCWNLLSNAVKFTPAGGRVSVRLTREGPELILRVSDTGEGIAPDVLPRLFERFQQADASITRKHKGLGIGLALSKHLLELHGGWIKAESLGKGQGSTFSAGIPVAGGALPAAQESRRLVAIPEGLSILIVEDEPEAVELLRAFLADSAPRIRVASSAEEALRSIRESAPDLIISDIGMPDSDGYALIRRVKALPVPLSAIPSIAVTAFARAEDRQRALEAGFSAYLSKPTNQAELLSTIAALVRES